MTPALTTAQMRAIDEQAIGGDVAVGYSYMLKAGHGLYDSVKKIVTKKDAGAGCIPGKEGCVDNRQI